MTDDASSSDDDCGCDGTDSCTAHPAETGSRTDDAESQTGDSGSRVSLSVPEMDCPSCAGKVESALATVDGADGAELRPTTGQVVIENPRGDVDAMVDAVEGAGYAVTGVDGPGNGEHDRDAGANDVTVESMWRSRRAASTVASGLFLFAGLAATFAFEWPNVVLSVPVVGPIDGGNALLLAGVAAGGWLIVRNGLYSARARSLDIDLLMSIAIVAATGVSLAAPNVELYVEAASLAFLFNVAELLERYSVDRARNSMAELLTLAPDVATVRRDGEPVEVPVEAIDVGEVVLVSPGERIPVDGVVVDGDSAVDQSPITGESVPVDKTPGDDVYAGTIAERGYLEVEVTALASDSTLANVIEQVERAQAEKTEREQFVDRFAGYYTPVVVVAAILSATVPVVVFGRPWVPWFLAGITFLVIACPCAFVISTPVSVVSGVTSAARNGVLVKGGRYLEAMGEVDAIAFDKTGTLTKGELAVTDVVPLNGNDERDVLRCARGLESRSEHPIADAIVDHAAGESIESPSVDAFETITGKGVRAKLDGRVHYAGKPSLFESLGFDLAHVHVVTDGGTAVSTADARVYDEVDVKCEREGCLDLLEETIPRLQREGKTVVLVGTEDELEGVVALADEVREDAKSAVAHMQSRGVQTVMLTGDNRRTAAAVAATVGIDEYQADLLPAAKVEAIEALTAEYGTVAMVGDGINDAPALATATVGIAMGAAGTDTAIETADVALMGDDLSKLPYVHRLSRKANRVIRGNIWGSLGMKAALAVGIPLGLVGVVHAVLLGDVGMTVFVTANAMRLGRLRP